MQYRYEGSQLICSLCDAHVESSHNDRHGCYWIELENSPIGMAALILRGQYGLYNPMEKRIAKAVWERIKIKQQPKSVVNLELFNATNLEVNQLWTKLGDEVFN